MIISYICIFFLSLSLCHCIIMEEEQLHDFVTTGSICFTSSPTVGPSGDLAMGLLTHRSQGGSGDPQTINFFFGKNYTLPPKLSTNLHF